MKVLLAKTAGFCMGVRRAVNLALETAKRKKGNIYTCGPLIHNPQVVEMLNRKNIKVINDISEVDSGTIVIRAHGIGPEEKERIEKSSLDYCDATCPLVVRIQSIISRYAEKGYNIVIVGDKGHAEVDALLGYTNGRGVVVENLVDLKDVPDGKLCVVAQSTQNYRIFDEVVKKIKKRGGEIKIFDTICDATTERQEEVKRLAKKVNAMVVVGGRNSANTHRLANISESLGVPTFFIETEDEIPVKEVLKYENIGVTAGASTPNWLIENVINKLREIKNAKTHFLTRFFSSLFNFLVKSDIYIGIGAGLLCFSSILLQKPLFFKPPPMLLPILISSFFVFAVHILNHYTDKEYAQYKESYKLDFLQKNKIILIPLGLLSAISAVILSFFLGWIPLLILVITTSTGLVYNFRIIPGKISRLIKIKRLRDVPASKNLGMAFAWCIIAVLIPLFERDAPFSVGVMLDALIVFIFAFTLVFTRSTLLDMRDVQSDMMVGNETIPIIFGRKRTKLLLLIILSICALLLLIGSIVGLISALGYFLLISVAYSMLYLYLYHTRVISRGIICEIAADSSFYLTGAVAFIYWILRGYS